MWESFTYRSICKFVIFIYSCQDNYQNTYTLPKHPHYYQNTHTLPKHPHYYQNNNKITKTPTHYQNTHIITKTPTHYQNNAHITKTPTHITKTTTLNQDVVARLSKYRLRNNFMQPEERTQLATITHTNKSI
jgi:hypothetical protein